MTAPPTPRRSVLPAHVTRWCVALAAVAGGAWSGRVPARAPARAAAGMADRAASTGELAYVSNEAGRTLSVIDVATDRVVATIPVGTRPRGVRSGPGGAFVYVALSGSPRCPPTMADAECARMQSDRSLDGIAEVDAVTRQVTRVLPGGTDPEQFALSPDGRRLYVSNEDAGTASVVDVRSGRVTTTVPVGREPEGVRVTPDGRTALVTSEAGNAVVALDASSGRVRARATVDARPRDIVVTRDGARYYVSAEAGGTVNIVDARRDTVLARIALPAGAKPMGLALSPDATTLYVATGRHGTVEFVDTRTRAVTGSVRVGARPWGIALAAAGRKLYVANGSSNDVSVIDVAARRVVATIPVGALPWGVAVAPAPSSRSARNGGTTGARTGVLRVCADPNNLPFSDARGRGFENRIARVLAAELHDTVQYTWWAQRRGFVRNTLKARRCDAVIGAPVGDEQLRTTMPYYRSTYVFVTRRGTPPVRSFDDPRLRRMRVGVHVIGADNNSLPPGVALTRRGIVRNVRGYSIYGDYRQESPPARLVEAVARGDVDVAVVWGPLAGYYARRSRVPLDVTPVAPTPADGPTARMDFAIALGVRRADDSLHVALERALVRRAGAVRRILLEYRVPLVGGDLVQSGEGAARAAAPGPPSRTR